MDAQSHFTHRGYTLLTKCQCLVIHIQCHQVSCVCFWKCCLCMNPSSYEIASEDLPHGAEWTETTSQKPAAAELKCLQSEFVQDWLHHKLWWLENDWTLLETLRCCHSTHVHNLRSSCSSWVVLLQSYFRDFEGSAALFRTATLQT